MALLLLTISPCQAQMGYWNPVPCDALGNATTNPQTDGAGYYLLTAGTQKATIGNTYPASMIAAALADNSYYTYLQAVNAYYYRVGSGPHPVVYNLGIYQGIGGYYGGGAVNANNSLSGGSGYYSVPATYGTPNSGFINGTVTSDVTGQMQLYWRVQWQGGGTPTPMPTSINLLLKSTLTANASVSYYSSAQKYGLSAQATASDSVLGAGYGDTLAASAGYAGNNGTPSPVITYHLVRASIAPLAGSPNVGIAEVYLNGTTHTFAGNGVPWGQMVNQGSYWYPSQTNGQTQVSANANVAGGVKIDYRTIVLHRDGARPLWLDAQGNKHGEWTDSNGVTHGETTYSYKSYTTETNALGQPYDVEQDCLKWQYFRPSFAGAWVTWPFPGYYSHHAGDTTSATPLQKAIIKAQTDYNDPAWLTTSTWNIAGTRTANAPAILWNWSPNESEDWELYGKCSMPYGSLNYQDKLPEGNPDVMTIYNGPSGVVYTATGAPYMTFGDADSGGPTDGATATATYMLELHDPVENLHQDGNDAIYAVSTFPPSQELDPNNSFNLNVPSENGDTDIGPVLDGSGAVLNTAATAVPFILADTNPYTAWISISCAAAGSVFPLLKSQQPLVTATASYSEFNTDCKNQQFLNTVAVGVIKGANNPPLMVKPDTTNLIRPDIARFSPSNSANHFILDKIAANYNPADPTGNSDVYFNKGKATLTSQAVGARLEFRKMLIGDGYDTAGKLPTPVHSHIDYPGLCSVIYTWTYTGDANGNHQ